MIDVGPAPQTLASRAATLFRQFRGGDEERLADLIALLTPVLWHTARSQRLDHQAAEDVLQVTWLALVRHAATIAEPDAVLQWLIVTARREAWRTVSRSDRLTPTEIGVDDLVAPAADNPEDAVLRTTSAGRLWQHVRALPDRCQALLRVVAFAERPDYAAIAEALGMPVGSIGPTRGRCLAKLRQLLEEDPEWQDA